MIKFVSGLAALLVIAAVAVGCGGDDKKTFDTGDGKVSVSKKLPDNFPKELQYKDADFEGSITGENDGIKGAVATWTSKDSVDDVASFYRDALKGDKWKSTSSGDFGDGSFFTAESADGKTAVYVAIGSNDGKTSITVTYGDNPSGSSPTEDTGDGDSGDEETPEATSDSGSDGDSGDSDVPLPDEANLSDSFPSSRVPLPDDIRVTSSSSFEAGGAETYYVEFYSKDSIDDLAKFFKDALPGKGWTNAFSAESDGTVTQSYTPADTSANEGVNLSISKSDSAGYNVVNLTVVVAPR